MKTMNQFLLFYMLIHACCCFFVSPHSFYKNSFTTNTTFTTCLPDQASILLQLKTEFTYEYDYRNITYPKMKHWNVKGGNSDCCLWDGVSCNLATGYVISLDLSYSWLNGPLRSNSSLFRLLHLQKLNLAFNDFTDCMIPSEFGRLSRLTYLNLSSSYFSGQIPYEISRLTNLTVLDLSENFLLFVRRGELGRLINQNMTNLRQLNLDSTDLSSAPVPKLFGNLFSLTHLSLRECSLFGKFPENIFQLPNIQFIYLSSNTYLNLSLPEFRSGSMLKSLDLSYTTISGELPDSIGNLKSLNFLLLQGCGCSGIVPPSLSNLTELSHLDLSFNHFNGRLPYALGNLGNLTSIDLRYNSFSGELLSSLGNLTKLESLYLSGNNFSGQIPSSLGNLTQLKFLYLSSNNFSGQIPSSLGNLTKLESLYLARNSFSGQIPSTLGNLTKLEYLDLSDNNFSGPILSSLGNLTQLKYLYLEYNSFSGQIPSALGNLTQLEVLSIGSNFLNGKLPISFPRSIESIYLPNNSLTGSIPSSCIANLTFLTHFELSYNSLTGVIPSSLFNLPSLDSLYLDNNQFTGSLNIHNISDSSRLKFLYLNGNKLTGDIPSSMFQLTMLNVLWLGSNDFSGRLDFGMFSALRSLESLDLSNNRELSFTNLTTKSSLPNFSGLYLSSCNNITEFPMFLKTQTQLVYLELADNRIGGQIPKWFLSVGTETLQLLNLSHNSITGWEEATAILPWKSLDVLDLHSNMLRGPLVVPPTSTWYFSASENSLTGNIDPLFCKLSYLQYLELSSNNLSGTIPRCFGNLATSLLVLNLRRNNFHGKMPKTCGDGSQLTTLDLSHNQLHGKIPKSLAECKELEILNLGHNQMSDSFPFWLQNSSKLQVLVLSSNKFYGPTWRPHNFWGFSNLKIIDLSFNDFTGSLPPQYFRNWTSMAENSDGNPYIGNFQNGRNYYSMTVIYKGLEMGFIRILSIFVSIDLSNNRFDGEIPTTIGGLGSLIVLNLSSNSFTGHIPASMRNLTELESLDLSNNKLSGEIPLQLSTSLTFLGYLNLSNNQFVGPIPQGGQIGTFPNSSFLGNKGLCGRPLSKMCEAPSPTPSPYNDTSQDDSIMSGFTWKVVAIGYACGVAIGVVAGHIIISRSPYLMWMIFRVRTQRRLRR